MTSEKAGGLGERRSRVALPVCPSCDRAGFHAARCPDKPSSSQPNTLEVRHMDDTVELQCKKCDKTWTEPKADFLARFSTGKLGHDCPAGASL